MRQEIDLHYVVAFPESNAIQKASNRTSCHNATANQARLVPHTAAFWLLLSLPSVIKLVGNVELCRIRERLTGHCLARCGSAQQRGLGTPLEPAAVERENTR